MEKKEMKLKLNKETIANLDNIQMNEIYGGDEDDGKPSNVVKRCVDVVTMGVSCIGDCKTKPIRMADDKCKVNKVGI
ncbi:class I lanthipeptide [Bacteroidota bacterium]